MPKIGPDKKKIDKIRRVLRENPKGLWIREIARQSRISKSTVHKYVNEYLQDEIEDVIKIKGGLIRLVRLKND